MTKRTVSSRLVCRGWVGVASLMGVVLGAGEARAVYNIKATEAPNFSLVTDGKCNLAEAIDSVNAGSAKWGCSNVGGGKKISLEGTGAHYKVGSGGVTITMTGVEITSAVANRDFIEGAVSSRVIMVNAGSGLTLTGLTIQRTGTARARVLENHGALTMTNCVVQNGDTTGDGGGIYNNGDLRMSGSTVRNNKADFSGGGIFTKSSIGVILSNTTVSNNTSGLSGGGIFGSVSPISLVVSTVSGNKSTASHAGGIYNNGARLYMDRATLSGNTAVKNGGGIYSYQGTLVMTRGTLTGAHTAVHGGGIYINGSAATFTSPTIEGATASGDGGGIYNLGGDVTLYGAKVTGANRAVNGGGIFNSNGNLELTRTTIEGATASADGGGIYHSGDDEELSLIDTTVQNNKATGNGGGVYSKGVFGIYFERSTISNNTADLKGGGIYSSSRALGKYSTISTNTAQGNGGGVYSVTGNNHYLELNWVTVGYNRGTSGAGIYLDGHANTQTRSSIVAKNQLWNGTFEDYNGNPHGQDADNAYYKSVFGECTNTMCRAYDIVGASNILPLADNGGLTKTHEIPDNSSAKNKFVAGPDWTCPATDQRGQPRPRPVGTACDLGSFERQQ